jgi:hypothetical protein
VSTIHHRDGPAPIGAGTRSTLAASWRWRAPRRRRVAGALFARLLACSRDERGDVPGWVLVTAMTVALVMMIWGIASNALRDILGRFLDGLRFGS